MEEHSGVSPVYKLIFMADLYQKRDGDEDKTGKWDRLTNCHL